MKQRHRNRPQLVDKFVRMSGAKGEIKLIAGVDPNPPDPHTSAVFYIRMESQDKDTEEPCRTESIWLTLNEMTRLSVLMSIASRFWVNTYYMDEPYSEERIKDFVTEYRKIRRSLERTLPEEESP